ncbi:MAG: hypothetical protein ISN28_13860, partial [Ectothiorhodospiraceae bacterium AqS1]|nr:hypothetical protein [Ectothiorhodospiraceae bacterium AqS1]
MKFKGCDSVTISSGCGSGLTVVAPVAANPGNISLSSTAALSLDEGNDDTFTVSLSAEPAGDVTITITSADTGAVSVSPTVTGKQDADGEDEEVVITLGATAASGIIADDVTRTVNIDDDEPPSAITLSGGTDALNVTEESTATFTVSIVPPSTKSVSVTLASSDTSIVTVSPTTLTFAANATAAQTVTVSALDDSDTDDESEEITLTATGGISTVEKPVAVRDNDIPAGNLVLDSTAQISIDEGGAGSFTVSLSRRPSKNVTVDIESANPGAVTADPASLTFTANNWETVQSVTVTGEQDSDTD